MGASAKIRDGELTPQEEQYAVAIIAHGGKRKEAYLEVYGPGVKNVTSAAAKLATKPHIAAYIDKVFGDQIEVAKTSANRVLAEVSHLAFSDMLDAFDVDGDKNWSLKDKDDIPKAVRASIKKLKFVKGKLDTIEFFDKTRPLQDIQRRLGLLGDRKDGEAQHVHIHLDMHGPAPAQSDVIDVTPDEAPNVAETTGKDYS